MNMSCCAHWKYIFAGPVVATKCSGFVRLNDGCILLEFLLRSRNKSHEISYDSPKVGVCQAIKCFHQYLHWGQGNRGAWLSEGVEMGKRGAVCITIDAPLLATGCAAACPRQEGRGRTRRIHPGCRSAARSGCAGCAQGCRPQTDRICGSFAGSDMGRSLSSRREADQDAPSHW